MARQTLARWSCYALELDRNLLQLIKRQNFITLVGFRRQPRQLNPTACKVREADGGVGRGPGVRPTNEEAPDVILI